MPGPTTLTPEQRCHFVRDGFVIVRGAVAQDCVARAREGILAGMPPTERRLLAPAGLATHPKIIGLARESCLATLLRNGENDDLRGTNDGLLWQDSDRRTWLPSYTALVGITLNDQLEPGNGQFAVLKGMHEEVETAFRMRCDSGGVIGPEGPGWPASTKRASRC